MLRYTSILLLTTATLFAADEPKKKAPVPIATVDLKRTTAVSFEKEILPLFAAKCQACHAGKVVEGKLDLSTYASLMKGGEHGVMIAPNKPDDSYLYKRAGHITGPIMPPKTDGDPFTPEELSLLRLWISQGAKPPAVDGKIQRVVNLNLPPALIKPVRAVAIHPDKTIVASGRSNQLHIYDAKTGEYQKTWTDAELKTTSGQPANAAHISLIESMAFSPDGKTLATGSYREMTLWDVAKGTPRARITGFADRVVAIAYSPDGKMIATAGGAPTEDGEVKLFDANGGSPRLIPNAHTDTVFGLAFHPNSTLLATAGSDRYVKVFDVTTLKLAKTFEGHTNHVLDVGWAAEGKKLVSCGADVDKMVKVWDYEKGEKVRDITSNQKQATRLQFAGKTSLFLLTAGDGSAKIWNAENAGQQKSFDSGKEYLYAAAISTDGKLVATGGEEGIVRLFNAENSQLIKAMQPTDAKEQKK
jgi:WD40 repeat protein